MLRARGVAVASILLGCAVATAGQSASGEPPDVCTPATELSIALVERFATCDFQGRVVTAAADLKMSVPSPGESAGVAVLRDSPSDDPSSLIALTTKSGRVAVSVDGRKPIGDAAASRELDTLLNLDQTAAVSTSQVVPLAVPSWCGTYTQYKLHNVKQPNNGYYQWYYRTSGEPSSGANGAISSGADNWVADSSTCGSRPNDARHRRINTTTRAPNVRDGYNVVGWASLSGSTLAYTNWWYEGSTIVEADIRFDNSSRSWHVSSSASVASGKYDLRSVAAHEFGHAFGFDHVLSSPHQVMFDSFGSGVERRVKRAGDLYGMQLKY